MFSQALNIAIILGRSADGEFDPIAESDGRISTCADYYYCGVTVTV